MKKSEELEINSVCLYSVIQQTDTHKYSNQWTKCDRVRPNLLRIMLGTKPMSRSQILCLPF